MFCDLANRKQKKSFTLWNLFNKKAIPVIYNTQFSYKTIRLTVYAMFHGKQKVGKHIYPSFKVLSSIYHCLEIGTGELGAQTYIYIFLLGGGAKKNFTKLRSDFLSSTCKYLLKGRALRYVL